jgi:density-regulated protein DRP1
LPPEYCDFTGEIEKCRGWLRENHPELHEQLGVVSPPPATALEATEKGKAPAEPEQKPATKGKKKATPKVVISRVQRNKRKFVTTVTGLEHFGVKLPEAAKLFAKKFSCGSSVVKSATGLSEEIDVQGDVQDELAEFIADKLNISEDVIHFPEEKKK